MSQDHADYTVEDYGAYYELSPRHSNAPALPNGSGSGSGEASAGSSGDVQGQGGKLPLSAGGTPGVNINPGSGLVHSTSYSLYGYGISDEYGEIYAGLSVEQREEERLRDAGRLSSLSLPSWGLYSLLSAILLFYPSDDHLTLSNLPLSTLLPIYSPSHSHSIRARKREGPSAHSQPGA